MSAAALLDRLLAAGVELSVAGDKLHVEAPNGAVTPEIREELVAHKAELIEELRRPSPLTEQAQEYAAVVCLTIPETSDVAGDIALLRRVRVVIEEFQSGANEVRVRLPALDGRRPVARWRALASRELRMALARQLAERGVPPLQVAALTGR